MNVLAIETSCDDTSVAIVNSDRQVLSCIIADQNKKHEPFGGVVPEIASRSHSEDLLPIVDQCLQKSQLNWSQIDGLAVTSRPGLVGSLIVGLVTAKTLALAKNIPYIGVHHLEGHIAAPFLCDTDYQGPGFYNEDFIALVVSGGHTSLYVANGFGSYKLLGNTIDDAAGEAFDKFAKVMGLPYPGGIHIDRLAKAGDTNKFKFPRPMIKEDYIFSFSGLKTAGQRVIAHMSPADIEACKNDLAASYQRAIIDVLSTKVKKAVSETGIKNVVVTGGVSANSLIRQEIQDYCDGEGINLGIPPLKYCTDNAAMIGLAGLWRMEKGERSSQDLAPQARAEL